MSPQLQIPPALHRDNHETPGPWSILPFADTLVDRRSSTTTRLGMPFVVRDLDDCLLGIEAMTAASVNFAGHFWKTYLTSTESGITYTSTLRPVREEVQSLRDEIVRRTRLTRQQIARAVGVDRRSLSSWVNGSAAPGPERLERLRYLAALVREIDSFWPGQATEVVLARRRGQDLLDMIAEGRFDQASNWQSMEPGDPSVRVTVRRVDERKPPLFAAALEAYRQGQLSTPPRAHGIHEAGDYEQDLDEAEAVFPDEPRRTRRGQYR